MGPALLRHCCLLLSVGARRRPPKLQTLNPLFKKRIKNPSFASHRLFCSSCSSLHLSGGIRSPEIPGTSPEIQLYNTLTNQKEPFRPRVPGKVGMYVCGITAYDLSNIGHARVSVTFDVLYRYLQHLDYEVCYVRNFTDVDDKIIARANELGEDPLSLSSRYCDEFHTDMACLHCLPPTIEPRVSDHMRQIIDMIKQVFDPHSSPDICQRHPLGLNLH